MRIAVLTSGETRHRYFANAVRARFPVVAVGYEQVAYRQAEIEAPHLSPAETRIVREHFAERSRQEEIFFGRGAGFIGLDAKDADVDCPQCAARSITPGRLNSPATIDFLESHDVDTVVVFGTNLIKPPLLGRFRGRMINLHLGLSPYYRGTATNFYPLLNLEPQYVGATIHLIDAGIDSGPILRHARPVLSANDPPHVIGCKAIQAGIDAMLDVLRRLDRADRLDGVPQWHVPNARLYMRKDYDQRQVVELYRKIDDGLLRHAIERALQSEPPKLIE